MGMNLEVQKVPLNVLFSSHIGQRTIVRAQCNWGFHSLVTLWLCSSSHDFELTYLSSGSFSGLYSNDRLWWPSLPPGIISQYQSLRAIGTLWVCKVMKHNRTSCREKHHLYLVVIQWLYTPTWPLGRVGRRIQGGQISLAEGLRLALA